MAGSLCDLGAVRRGRRGPAAARWPRISATRCRSASWRGRCAARRAGRGDPAAESAIGLARRRTSGRTGCTPSRCSGPRAEDRGRGGGAGGLELEPDLAATWQILARCLMARRDRAKARDAAERALALDPEDASSHAILGDIALELGQARLAERHLRAALAREPEDPVLLNNLGVALRAQDREGESAQVFEARRAAGSANEVVARRTSAPAGSGHRRQASPPGCSCCSPSWRSRPAGCSWRRRCSSSDWPVVVVLGSGGASGWRPLQPGRPAKVVEDSRRGPRRRRSHC